MIVAHGYFFMGAIAEHAGTEIGIRASDLTANFAPGGEMRCTTMLRSFRGDLFANG
jgi:hypothetical protein